MKIFLCISIHLILPSIIFAQHLDVEGDARIEGKLNIINADGDSSIFIGFNAGMNDEGQNDNVFVGNSAGKSNTLGLFNSFFGNRAGFLNQMGQRNSFFGTEAGYSNMSGFSNSFIGNRSGFFNTSGYANSFIGESAGRFNNAGNQNSFFGVNSGQSNSNGQRNTYLGYSAGLNNTGDCNVFFGAFAGATIEGNFNVCIGYASGPSSPFTISNKDNLSHKLFIHNFYTPTPLIYGEFNNRILRFHGETQVETNSLILRNLGDEDLDRGLILQESHTRAFGIIYDGEGGGLDNRMHIREYVSGSPTDVMTFKGNGNVGIGITDPVYPLDVSGRIRGAEVFCGSTNACSDVRFKRDFTTIPNAYDLIAQLQGYYHYWNSEDFPEWNFKSTRQIGFKAQEIQKVLPELVSEMSDGMLAVDYTKMVPVLVEAIKEMKLENERLYQEIQSIKASLNE